MRCRSYRKWGEALRRNLEASRNSLISSDTNTAVKTYIIDYKNNTINRIIDYDKKPDTISTSP